MNNLSKNQGSKGSQIRQITPLASVSDYLRMSADCEECYENSNFFRMSADREKCYEKYSMNLSKRDLMEIHHALSSMGCVLVPHLAKVFEYALNSIDHDLFCGESR